MIRAGRRATSHSMRSGRGADTHGGPTFLLYSTGGKSVMTAQTPHALGFWLKDPL